MLSVPWAAYATLPPPPTAAETAMSNSPAILSGGNSPAMTYFANPSPAIPYAHHAGWVSIIPGAGTTQCVVRIRQGFNTVSGPQIPISNPQPFTFNVTPGVWFNLLFDVYDISPWTTQTGGGPYTLTLQCIGQTAPASNPIINWRIEV